MTAPFGFPINLAVRDRTCVVVGGGDEAALRVQRLRDAGADLVVITPSPNDRLRPLLDDRVDHRARGWRPEDLDDAILAIATREDPIDAAAFYAAGAAHGALVNVLDDVPHCDFAAMALIAHGDLQISIASNGRAPAVAKVLRRRLEAQLGPEWGELVAVANEAKLLAGQRTVDFATWAARWSDALTDTDHLLAQLRHGQQDAVRHHLVTALHGRPPTPSTVYLVGAGPGDPDLLTVKAARLVANAEVVVHDQLVAAPILDLASPDAELVPVGRRHGRVVRRHEDVIDDLTEAALRGRRVVRLKGGDPVVFGRGTEEALALAERGIATELVPGVTSAVAAPELAGIPLTHRGVASGFLVMTGQQAPDADRPVDWSDAARFPGTLVVLMAATRVGQLCAELVRCGRDTSTPAALVQRAGLPDQRVVTATLADLSEVATRHGVATPAVLVVGEVVRLRGAVRDALTEPGPEVAAPARPYSLRTSTADCL